MAEVRTGIKGASVEDLLNENPEPVDYPEDAGREPGDPPQNPKKLSKSSLVIARISIEVLNVILFTIVFLCGWNVLNVHELLNLPSADFYQAVGVAIFLTWVLKDRS